MVYVSNLPYDIKWNALKDFIREKTGELARVEVLEDKFGKSKGAAVCEFENKQAAVISIEKLHRADVSGRSIVVKEIRVLLFQNWHNVQFLTPGFAQFFESTNFARLREDSIILRIVFFVQNPLSLKSYQRIAVF